MVRENDKIERKEARDHEDDDHDVPITANIIIKWTSIVFTLISGIVSLVWFAAVVKGDIITLQQQVISLKETTELRDTQQDKDIDKLKERADNLEKSIGDMGRKLDVAVTLLERIDKKVGNP